MAVYCQGTVVTDTTVDPGAALCQSSTGTPGTWIQVQPFDVSQLDYGQAGEAFAAGFVIVAMCWALGKAVKAIMSVIGGR